MVALGAAVGAPARYLTNRAFRRRYPSAFPWGTLAVNVVASFVLGVVAGGAGHVSSTVQALLATGLCGALSTFSTFGYEVNSLARTGRTGVYASYVVLSVAAGLAAVSAGWAVGSAL